jgi:hypothetical protein
MTNEFLYTLNEKEFICTLPVEQIDFDGCENDVTSARFKSGFPAIDNETQNSFYQVLAEGKASLLKKYSITWRDDKPYNSGTTTRIFTAREILYLNINGSMFKLDKNNSNLATILSSKMVNAYLAKEKRNLKKDDEVIRLIEYYNSL